MKTGRDKGLKFLLHVLITSDTLGTTDTLDILNVLDTRNIRDTPDTPDTLDIPDTPTSASFLGCSPVILSFANCAILQLFL